MATLILADITDSCRLCLKTGANIRNIFSNNDKKWAEIDISEQIHRATTIKVTINDGAIGICRLCLQNVISVNNFQRKCSKVDEYLKRKYQGIYFNSIGGNDHKPTELSDFAQFVDIGEDILDTKTFLLDGIDGFSNSMPSSRPFDEFMQNDEDNKKLDLNYEDDADAIKGKSENSQSSDDEEEKKNFKCKSKKRKRKSFDEPWPKLKKRDLNPSNPKVGLCHICGKNFNRLWIHLQSHNDVPTFTCDICGRGFQLKATLTIHILLHKDAEIACKICDKRYRTKMRLNRHMRVHTNDRPFSCPVCSKKFYTKYNVGVHMRIHTGEKPFNCDYCADRFTHSYGLKHHLKKFHSFPES